MLEGLGILVLRQNGHEMHLATTLSTAQPTYALWHILHEELWHLHFFVGCIFGDLRVPLLLLPSDHGFSRPCHA